MSGFDLMTHQRDVKSGRIIGENLYSKVVVVGPQGEPTEIYERPVKSGIFYNADGSVNMERSAEGLRRAEEKKKEAEKSAEQRYNDELEAARKLLAAHAEKSRLRKQGE